MKTLTLLFFILGICFMVAGYMDMMLTNKKGEKKIEYRFVPRSYFEQISEINDFNDLFDGGDVLSERRNLNSNLI